MPPYTTEIDGVVRVLDLPTGDYRMAAVVAVAMADKPLPCYVKIWCETLLPEYGPYWYKVMNDEYVRLLVRPVFEIKSERPDQN